MDFREEAGIKNSNSAARAKLTKIRAFPEMAPVVINKIAKSQNGIQIIDPNIIPRTDIE